MKIANNAVVSFHYVLTDAITNEQLESSYTRGTAQLYLHGHAGLISGLERAMDGRSKGEQFSVTVEPAEAYGERVEGRMQRVSLKQLAKTRQKIVPGLWLQVQTDKGAQVAVVKKVGMTVADLDMNHPMAGKTMTFKVEILDVREATAEEISHKHAHGDGGVVHEH
jgi:FKBP-type peptidyl-prolyl cis-trans isomerase SlyD